MKKQIGLAVMRAHKRPVAVLLLFGLLLTSLWWWNATLVYDDVILTLKDSSPYGFNFLVGRDGWFATLLHFLCLDLPDQYRTYGLSRSLQFILWSVGISSAKSYSLIISSTHVVSVLVLYFLLLRIGRSANDALIFCVIWLLSPYVWTSCFHHYSYLALPTQILIVGSFLLLTLEARWRKNFFAAILGVVCGLTGELHLVAVCLVLGAVAGVTRDKSFARTAVVTNVAMVCAIAVHYLLWKTFESNPELRPRFALSLSHDWPYWSFRIWAAVRSIYFAFAVPVNEMDPQFVRPFLAAMLGFSLLAFAALWWVNKGLPLRKYNKQFKKDTLFSLMLIVVALSYFSIYMAVVILSDGIPHTMPRRYGYMPLTMILTAGFGILLFLLPWPGAKAILASLAIGATGAAFLVHQIWILPTIRSLDLTLNQKITDELEKSPGAGILFFNASNKDLPRRTIWPDSFGPAMQSSEGTEYTQATYGTYWPAEMAASRFLKAKFACDIGHVLPDGQMEMYCPYGNIKKYTNPLEVIVVANLGYEEKDSFGRSVRIFPNLNAFMPYYFSRKIIRENDFSQIKSRVFFDLPMNDFLKYKQTVETQSIAPINNPTELKLHDDVLAYVVHSHASGVNVGKARSEFVLNTPSIEASVGIKKKDLDIILIFEVSNPLALKKYLRNTYVSWNDGAWVSLGDDQLSEKYLTGEVGIRLSHLNSTQFSILVPSASSAELGFTWRSLSMASK